MRTNGEEVTNVKSGVTALAGLALMSAIAAAPSAQADDSAYLQSLSDKWFLQIIGPDKLIQEGHKVCQIGARNAVDMIQADLSVPSFTAAEIASAAKINLDDCRASVRH